VTSSFQTSATVFPLANEEGRKGKGRFFLSREKKEKGGEGTR